MIKVSIITTAHSWNDVRVTHRLARSFVEQGFQVDWFGPNPEGDFKELYGINFHFFENSKGKFARLTASNRLLALLKKAPLADIYLAVDPDSAAIASRFSINSRVKSIFDIHEIYHKDMLLHWCPKIMIPFAGFFIREQIAKTCKSVDLVIGVGKTRLLPYKKYIRESMIVRHCVPKVYVDNLPEKRAKNPNEIRIVQGKISIAQGSLQMLRAAKIASKKLEKKVVIVLFEIYSSDLTKDRFNNIIKKESLAENLLLLPKVSYEKMFPILADCNIGVISYQRSMGVNCMPNRVFEYMSVGLPMIVPSYSIEMNEIISKYKCGVSTDMENPDDIASTICEIVNTPDQMHMYSENSLKAFKNECNWESESKPLIDWIKRNTNTLK